MNLSLCDTLALKFIAINIEESITQVTVKCLVTKNYNLIILIMQFLFYLI